MNEEHQQRVDEIGQGLDQLKAGWPFLTGEIEARVKELIEILVNQESEQTRGQIKALRWVLSLPSDLRAEREGMESALSELDAGV